MACWHGFFTPLACRYVIRVPNVTYGCFFLFFLMFLSRFSNPIFLKLLSGLLSFVWFVFRYGLSELNRPTSIDLK